MNRAPVERRRGWRGAGRVLAVLGALLAARAADAQSSVELRAAAVVPAEGPVHLSDVATLTGPDAAALGDTVVVESASERLRGAGGQGSCVLTVEEVRRALKARPGGGVRWSALTIRGWKCTLSTARARVEAPPEPAKGQGPSAPPPEAAPAADAVRALVAAKIAEVFGVERDELRLDFDDGDSAVLDARAGGGTVEVVPTGLSDRLPLSITVYDGDRVRLTKSIRVGVQVKREVAVAASAKKRGEAIGAEDVKVEERWVGPTLRRATPDRVAGSVARSRIAPGAVVLETDIEQPVAVKKGERVEVHCVSGRVIVKTRARALASGREGDLVMFESLDGTKRTFPARVDGRGRAVTAAGGAEPSGSAPVNEKGTP